MRKLKLNISILFCWLFAAGTPADIFGQCTIGFSYAGNPSACNDNGTPEDPSDDFFTQDIFANFFNRPLTGSLQIVPGGDAIGTYEIPVTQIVGNQHLFNDVQFKADGTPTVISLNFTDEPTCIETETGPTVQSCSVVPVCSISFSFSGSQGPCNDNGTPADPSDDFFTQNLFASFFNRPLTGSLQVVPGGDQIGTYSIPVQQIVGNQHIFNNVKFKADGTPTLVSMNFTDEPACVDEVTGPTVQPCSAAAPQCEVIGMTFNDIGPCNDNGTATTADDFFLCDVQVLFANPPATGNLSLGGAGVLSSASVPVGSLSGGSFTFLNVHLLANGNANLITATFSANPSCTGSSTGPAVNSCSSGAVTCNISQVTVQNVGPCNDNGTGILTDDFFTADVLVNFSGAPATGNLQIELPGDVVPGGGATSVPVGSLSGGAHTFSGVRFKADGTITVVEVEFSANQACVRTGSGPVVQPCSVPCSISSVSISNAGSCNNNGTPSTTDDYFTADVSVTFSNPPATGNLQIEQPGDVVPGGGASSVPVANLSGNSHTFTGVRFKADGTLTVAEVEFSADQSCVRTTSGPAVQPCSVPMSISCPPHATVSCVGQAPPVNLSGVTVLENSCPGAPVISLQIEVNSGQVCDNRLNINRIYQATNNCGEIATCSQIIAVNDQTPPTITCPPNVTVSCAGNVPPANTASVTGLSDNCGGTVSVIAYGGDAISNQTCTNRFVISRTYLAVDACLNSAFCTQTITVNDQTAPTLTCPASLTVSCAGNVVAASTASVTGVSDNCGGTPTVAHVGDVISNQTCINRFTVTRTYRATDACNNSATCSQIITVNDQIPPALTCPVNVAVSCANQVPVVSIASVTGLSDNCSGAPTVTHMGDVITNQTCPNRFTLTRTYRAADACNNSATCSQVITVNDQTAPVFLNIPANVTVDCYLVPPPATVNASDNCGTANVSYLGEVKVPGICPVYYVLTRSWLATDACGNTASTSQVITVTDDRAPQFILQPQDVLVQCSPTSDAAFEAWQQSQGGGVAEDCAPITWTMEDSPVPGGYYVDCGNSFQRTIRFTATDECGNSAFRDATFTVIDITPPVFTHLPESRTVECSDSGDGSVDFYQWLDNHAFSEAKDECGSVVIETEFLGETPGCGNTWIRKFAFTATDDCGNQTTAVASFSVVDHTPPVIVACPPNNLYLTCVEDLTPPDAFAVVAHDQCGSVSATVTNIQKTGTGCPSSPMIVNYTYTVTDDCGNAAACFQQLRVIDNSVAEINIPDTIKVACIDDIPGEYAVEKYLLDLLNGPCNATRIAVLEDLGLVGNQHSYRIRGRDVCRNQAQEEIVTFVATGNCAPLCTATSEAWGTEGADIGFHPVGVVVDSVTAWFGGVKAGSFGRSLTVGGANCFTTLVGSGGDCSIFEAGQYVANDNNGCQLPAGMLQPDGSLHSELGTNVLALQLNIWYNKYFNNRDLGVQDLKDLPACMVDYSIMKSLGNYSTWQDLLNLANEYLGAANAYPYPDGFCALLNEAIANVNVLHQNCTPVPPCTNKQSDQRSEEQLSKSGAMLVPNPATDQATLVFDADANGTTRIQITGINGTVFTREYAVQKGVNRIDLGIGDLAAGIYAVQVQGGVALRLVKIGD